MLMAIVKITKIHVCYSLTLSAGMVVTNEGNTAALFNLR